MKLNDKVYDVLKWIALVVLPALSVFYATIAGIWNLPYATQIPLTIDAIDVFIGALIGVSHLTIKKEESDEEK